MFDTHAYAQNAFTPTPTLALDPIYRANIELAEAQVSNIRGLPIATVNKQAVTPEELSALVQADFESKYTIETAQADAAFYQALGLLPYGVDLYSIANSIVTTSPTDYYNPVTNTVYMLPNISEGPLSLNQTVRYGENYIYALLENQFNAFTQLNATNNLDQATAMRAVIEGDMRFTLELLLIELIQSGTYSLESLLSQAASVGALEFVSTPPPILAEEATWGSEAGYRFVSKLYSETNTWRLVNLLYERPPLSTEHILHPTLYLLYEQPEKVAPISLEQFWSIQESNHWQLVVDQTVGEFYLRQHLLLGLDEAQTDQVATGWGGDRMMIYASAEGEFIMLWRISFDTTTDFNEFAQGYRTFLNNWLLTTESATDHSINCWEASNRNVCFASINEDVLIVSAPSLTTAQEILQFQINALTAIFG
ncbi:MAG: hypothetical protein CUN55_02285 [Phototrophicales bacterium]|nr:MAG: hypothetical protein CUN55_02285 [Phototrophicales bacterium]